MRGALVASEGEHELPGWRASCSGKPVVAGSVGGSGGDGMAIVIASGCGSRRTANDNLALCSTGERVMDHSEYEAARRRRRGIPAAPRMSRRGGVQPFCAAVGIEDEVVVRDETTRAEQCRAAIQNAYWIFTRTKRGRPPAAELYERRNAREGADWTRSQGTQGSDGDS